MKWSQQKIMKMNSTNFKQNDTLGERKISTTEDCLCAALKVPLRKMGYLH